MIIKNNIFNTIFVTSIAISALFLVASVHAENPEVDVTTDSNRPDLLPVSDLDKRFPWFVIGWIYGVVQGGFSLYGLANLCKDFSESTSNKIGCVSGAIGTAVTIAGAGWAGWNKYIEIGNALINAPKHKRAGMTGELEEQFTKITGLSASHVGFVAQSHNSKSEVMLAATSSNVPVMRMITPHNQTLHFAIRKVSEKKFHSILGFHVNDSTTTKSTREDFNEENFLNGGVEFSHFYVANEDNDGGILNQQNDWNTIYDQTYCQANKDLNNDHNRNYVQYQIYDHNNEGTIAAGTVIGFNDQPNGFQGVTDEPNSLPEDSACAIN